MMHRRYRHRRRMVSPDRGRQHGPRMVQNGRRTSAHRKRRVRRRQMAVQNIRNQLDRWRGRRRLMADLGWWSVGVNWVDVREAVPRLATLATFPTSVLPGGELRTGRGQQERGWRVVGRVWDLGWSWVRGRI
uniref:(northern house mosquito) hypothetical protein n=1 Tax=Culex pipiens TaxID=7175 RepID=A0A8D8AV86_CULPI